MSEEITFEHIRAAAEWALTAKDKPMPIDGTERMYRQHTWECGTTCCIWGAAKILATGKPFELDPGSIYYSSEAEFAIEDWSEESDSHFDIYDLLSDQRSTPEEVLSLLDEIEGRSK